MFHLQMVKQMSIYDSQIREVVNRNTFVSLALDKGFNAFLPVYDGGIDLILHHEDDSKFYKVQLKGRWTIDRKYIGRDIWIAFPFENEWYLLPHDEMVASAEKDGAAETSSWKDKGIYSRPKLSKAVLNTCSAYHFGSIASVASSAAEGQEG